MATTIPIEGGVRDRLRAHGQAGMSYSEIITRLLDRVDREAFLAELTKRVDDPSVEWVPLDEVGWDSS